MFGFPTAYLDEGTQFLNLNKDSANYKREFSYLPKPFEPTAAVRGCVPQTEARPVG